jgi:hypothetical protein
VRHVSLETTGFADIELDSVGEYLRFLILCADSDVVDSFILFTGQAALSVRSADFFNFNHA